MTKDNILDLIRTRAYFMWEQAGRPAGGDLEFWDEARRQVEREEEEKASLASLS